MRSILANPNLSDPLLCYLEHAPQLPSCCAHLEWEDCPTCTAEAKLIAVREMKVREKGKDPVGIMMKKKTEAATAAKKGRK
jgi:hypothetical protein